MRMQEFKEGKLAVYAETKDEALRFLTACEEEGLLWRSGDAATGYGVWPRTEYAYDFFGDKRMTENDEQTNGSYRNTHAEQIDNASERPYTSISVDAFFEEDIKS